MITLSDNVEAALFGEDLFFEDDLQVTASGDYALIEGAAAVKQAILNRLLTTPGEYAPFPDYGVGIRAWVKKRRSRSEMDSLRSLIFEQIVKETRIDKVLEVLVERDDENSDNPGIKVTARVSLLGREQSFVFPTFTE